MAFDNLRYLFSNWKDQIILLKYSNFHNYKYRDGLLVPVLDCLTGFYAGYFWVYFLPLDDYLFKNIEL